MYDHHLVRTDSREQTLDAFLPPASCSQEGDLSTEVSQSGGASETRRLAAESTHSRATKTTSQDDKETEVMEVDELPEKSRYETPPSFFLSVRMWDFFSRSPVKRKRDVEEEGGYCDQCTVTLNLFAYLVCFLCKEKKNFPVLISRIVDSFV